MRTRIFIAVTASDRPQRNAGTGRRGKPSHKFPATLRAHLAGVATRKPVEIWFADAMRATPRGLTFRLY